MIRFFIAVLFITLRATCVQATALDTLSAKNVHTIITLFQQRDTIGIIQRVRYPLHRSYPIPYVATQSALRKHFAALFDDSLVALIARSTPEQWSEVGCRGIMLDNGLIWIDDEGFITAVNYQSNLEKQMEAQLIAQQKAHLHSSIKSLERPVYRIQTKHYFIRIDKLGEGQYRYASWKSGNAESCRPAMVLSAGTMVIQGSGGNHSFTFTNGNYSYTVYRNIIGEDDAPDFTLEVSHRGSVILSEGGALVF